MTASGTADRMSFGALTPFPGAVRYLRIYRRHVGRRLYVVFALSALTSLTEGVGIALLIPLLSTLNVGDSVGAQIPGIQRVVGLLGVGDSVKGILVLIGFVFGVKAVIKFAGSAYEGHLVARLIQNMKGRLFDACVAVRYEYYASQSAGHMINVVHGQANGFFSSLTSYTGFLAGILQALTYVSLALWISWQFGLMAIAVGLTIWLGLRSLNRHLRAISIETSKENSRLNRFLVQVLQSFKYLSATQQIDRMRQDVINSLDKLTRFRQRQSLLSAATGSISEPLSIIFIICIIIVQIELLKAPITPILVSILLFHRGLAVMLGVQGRWQSVLASIGSVEMVESELAAFRANREPNGTQELGTLSQGIRLENVTFEYGNTQRPAIADLSLEIPARMTVAFVGASGAGKSTLIDLLTILLRPQKGAIYIDNVRGDRIELTSWRSQVGFVSQETIVFDETIAANIAMSRDLNVRDAELMRRIETAARRAHIHHFVETLPDGYLTQVGDRGVRLSGGQRQRLFIARELYKEPNLLILDEATSALDSESERQIQDSIDGLKGRMTVVMIAHRLATIRKADRIFVMDEGRIVECGSYDELLSRPGSRFRTMVELQRLNSDSEAFEATDTIG